MRNNMKDFLKKLKWIILIIILLMISIYGYKQYQDYQTKKQAEESVIKVACVGDSNTYRHGGSNVDEYKYSYYLSNMLGKGYEVKNFGEIGACINPNGNFPYRSLRVYDAGIAYEADIIIIMLGTNDVWDYNWESEDLFKQEYLKLIDSYLQTEHVPEVYLCTLPKLYQEDGNTLEEGNGERVALLSNVVREIAKEHGYQVIEINQITDNHHEWYERDCLHINKDGAKEIASAMAEAIK